MGPRNLICAGMLRRASKFGNKAVLPALSSLFPLIRICSLSVSASFSFSFSFSFALFFAFAFSLSLSFSFSFSFPFSFSCSFPLSFSFFSLFFFFFLLSYFFSFFCTLFRFSSHSVARNERRDSSIRIPKVSKLCSVCSGTIVNISAVR